MKGKIPVTYNGRKVGEIIGVYQEGKIVIDISLKRRLRDIIRVIKEDGLWVARIRNLDIASQGKTKKGALKNLKDGLDLWLEEAWEELGVKNAGRRK